MGGQEIIGHLDDARGHLQKAFDLYKEDFNTLQKYEQKIQALADENSRLLQEKNKWETSFRAIHINLENANKQINEQKKQNQDLLSEKNVLQQSYQQLNGDFQECKQKTRALADENSRLLHEKNKWETDFRSINISLENANKQINEQKKQNQDLLNEKNALQQCYQQLNGDFQEYKQKIRTLEDEKSRLLEAKNKLQQTCRQLQISIDDSQRKVAELEKKTSVYKRETEKPLVQAAYEERSAGVKKASKSGEWPSILDTFNRWAANPVPRTLSPDFTYAEGEFRIRSKNDYQLSSSSGSKWIVNTRGDKKYLLPNPLAFNQLTNISELYHMDMSRLQPSNNKIEIVKPCELLDEGYINYPGELNIL